VFTESKKKSGKNVCQTVSISFSYLFYLFFSVKIHEKFKYMKVMTVTAEEKVIS